MDILIYTQKNPIPEFSGTIVLWNLFVDDSNLNLFSIPSELEKKPAYYRNRYLEWVESIGKESTEKKTLEEEFCLGNSFSFWWTNLVFEKNYGKSSRFTNFVKIVVLEKFLNENDIQSITYQMDEFTELHVILEKYCAQNFIKYSLQKNENASKNVNFLFSLRSMYDKFPHVVRGIIRYFLFWIQYRKLQKRNPKVLDGEPEIVLYDYFFHLKKNPSQLFESAYWSELISTFRKEKIKVLYYHIFVPSQETKKTSEAVNRINQFNLNSNQQEAHFFLEQLDWKILWKVFASFLKLVVLFYKNKNRLRNIQGVYKRFYLWPLLKDEISDSMIGSVLIQNLFYFYFVEKSLSKFLNKPIILYLLENQSWEKALTFIGKSKSDKLIGCAHSTVRFWDLRYFHSPICINNPEYTKSIFPNYIAINGELANQTMLSSGFPSEYLKPVEALRYLNLQKVIPSNPSKTKNLVVFTDYLDTATEFQMKLLVAVYSFFEMQVIVKFHPAHPIKETDFFPMRYRIWNSGIDQLLAIADVAYTSNVTSAAIDAYYLGIPVITSVDPENLNLSPLLGLENVFFATTERNLKESLEKCFRLERKTNFNLLDTNRNLEKWKNLLQIRNETK